MEANPTGLNRFGKRPARRYGLAGDPATLRRKKAYIKHHFLENMYIEIQRQYIEFWTIANLKSIYTTFTVPNFRHNDIENYQASKSTQQNMRKFRNAGICESQVFTPLVLALSKLKEITSPP